MTETHKLSAAIGLDGIERPYVGPKIDDSILASH